MDIRQYFSFSCMILLALACFPKADRSKQAQVPQIASGYQLNLSTYESCESLQQDIASQFAAYHYYEEQMMREGIARNEVLADVAESADEGAAGTSEQNGEESITNLQEKGVDEPDFVKRNDHHIYVMHGSKLEVLDRTDLNHIGTITIEDFQESWDSSPGPIAEAGRVGDYEASNAVTAAQVYAFANRLILLGNSAWNELKVLVYESSADGLPKQIAEWKYQGRYLNSRLSQNKLYLLLNDYLEVDEAWKSSPDKQPILSVQDGKVQDIPCHKIVRPSINDMDFSLSKVVSLDVAENPQEIDIIAVLGASSELYMSPNNIYVVKQGFYWRPWLTDSDESFELQTVISKIRLDASQGVFLPFAHGKVTGYLKDQWSMKELADGSLAVATTSYQPLKNLEGLSPKDNLERGRNHMWLLADEGEELNIRASILNFGEPGEDIRAVRYVDSKAYVVTFLNTDPLYSFDLTDSENPRLLGQLKVPGFSTYLHPVDGVPLMLGLGFDAIENGTGAVHQGLLLSLFQVESPEEMTRSDYRIIGQRGSYSDATANHHAFFYEPSQQWLGFPVVELLNRNDSSPFAYGDELGFSGAIFYQITNIDSPQDATFEEIARISHSDLMPANCLARLSSGRWWSEKADSLDINRIFRHQDWLITVSRFGLKALTIDGSFEEAISINFNHLESCP